MHLTFFYRSSRGLAAWRAPERGGIAQETAREEGRFADRPEGDAKEQEAGGRAWQLPKLCNDPFYFIRWSRRRAARCEATAKRTCPFARL